jgi:hypothetical protein
MKDEFKKALDNQLCKCAECERYRSMSVEERQKYDEERSRNRPPTSPIPFFEKEPPVKRVTKISVRQAVPNVVSEVKALPRKVKPFRPAKPAEPDFYVGMETRDLIEGMMQPSAVYTQHTGDNTGEDVAAGKDRVPSLHPWIETPDKGSIDVIDFILRYYVKCHLSFSSEKFEEYKEVCKKRPQFKCPIDLAPRQPFRNGVGPQGGLNEQHGYSGDIILRTPKDLEELKVFDRFSLSASFGARYRKERLKFIGKNDSHIRIRDTRLLLFLMDRYPAKVYLDLNLENYPTVKRYRPYDPEGARLRKEKNKKEGVA